MTEGVVETVAMALCEKFRGEPWDAVSEGTGLSDDKLNRGDFRDMARVAIAALQSLGWGPAAQWQPIETAPKDGTRICVAEYWDGGQHPSDAKWTFWTDYWRKYREGCGEGFGRPALPSHWMPLPELLDSRDE